MMIYLTTVQTHDTHSQRNGGIDPTEALKACGSIVQKTPELYEFCKNLPQDESFGQNGYISLCLL